MTTPRSMLKNPDIAPMLARKFHKKNIQLGIEYEVLEQEAYKALWMSETDGFYDPYQSALRTFSNTCINRHLLTYVLDCAHKHPVGITISMEMPLSSGEGPTTVGEIFYDASPDPEHQAIFSEMLRQLPEDARTVAALIFGDASAYGGITPRAAKKLIASALGWTDGRLRAAYKAIEIALAEPV